MIGIRYRFLLAAATLMATAAGCTLEPRFMQPPPPIADAYPAATGSGTVTADEIGWRDFFTDPRLQRLIGLALQNNRDLRVAILNVEQARAEYRIARAALFPTLNGNASLTRSRTPADLSPFGTSVISNDDTITADAAWEIDLFGKNRSLSRAAIDKYLATREARRAAQMSLVAQVADQYLTILAYEKELAVTANILTTAQANLALAKAEFGAGNQTALDFAEAETVVDQAQANLAEQQRLRDQANNALELLVGEPIPTDLPPPLPLDSQNLLADIPAGLPSDLLTRRPDILEAEDSLRAANADIGAARAAFFPSLSLTGEYGTASSALTGLFGSNRAIWSFGPSLNIPVFEGGTNFANLESAKAQQGIAVAEYEKAIQAGFQIGRASCRERV